MNIVTATQTGIHSLMITIIISFLFTNMLQGQPVDIKIYPVTYDLKPQIESPTFLNDSMELMLVITKKNQFGLVPVTVENGKPLVYSYKLGTFMGKDQQLMVDQGDFPFLASTGLHLRDQLKSTEIITGIPVNVINCTARPNGYSASGFIAEDEDLIGVLENDNQTVMKLGLTHPQLARPLFHVWNLILKEYELGKWGRYYDNVKQIYYNNNLLNLEVSGSKGWQISIFHDEIQGRHNIQISRELTAIEEKYLDEKYAGLTPDNLKELKFLLTRLNFSEMLPYYIMRYGFYEGHTEYRCDPVSITLIFGLASLAVIDKKLEGQLYHTVLDHFHSE